MSAFELLFKVAFKLLTWQFLKTISFPNPELALRIQWDRSLRTPVAALSPEAQTRAWEAGGG